MRLPLFRRFRGGAERAVPEPTQPDAKIDPLETVIGYLAGDIKNHQFRDDLIREVNILPSTRDLSGEAKEALVDRILEKRVKAPRRQ